MLQGSGTGEGKLAPSQAWVGLTIQEGSHSSVGKREGKEEAAMNGEMNITNDKKKSILVTK